MNQTERKTANTPKAAAIGTPKTIKTITAAKPIITASSRLPPGYL
ncbi:unnamed protein product [marine sediment metagenome]|uniref:Uncharacterized protein n=1 Tax=marine sediment metagenome TaxID=412755 RepID=X1QFU3_9ZZZZ